MPCGEQYGTCTKVRSLKGWINVGRCGERTGNTQMHTTAREREGGQKGNDGEGGRGEHKGVEGQHEAVSLKIWVTWSPIVW